MLAMLALFMPAVTPLRNNLHKLFQEVKVMRCKGKHGKKMKKLFLI